MAFSIEVNVAVLPVVEDVPAFRSIVTSVASILIADGIVAGPAVHGGGARVVFEMEDRRVVAAVDDLAIRSGQIDADRLRNRRAVSVVVDEITHREGRARSRCRRHRHHLSTR